jgi:hypothetical protein
MVIANVLGPEETGSNACSIHMYVGSGFLGLLPRTVRNLKTMICVLRKCVSIFLHLFDSNTHDGNIK